MAMSRALIALGMSLALVGSIGVRPAFSESTEKEAAPEKSAPRSPQPPTASENQPAPHKPSTEAKPQSPPTKAEAAPHKPSADAKLPVQTPSAPTTKVEPPADKEKDASELKEKEPVVKKPLGSLILSVKLALMGDSRLFRYDVEVEDDQQTVTLTGRVTSEEEKSAATEVAQAVSGVKTVVNKISLEKDLAKALLKKQDEILTTMIKERFAKSATLKAANFDVKTEEGIVQLNGSVRFQVLALEAAEAARQVPGVRAVNTEKVRLEGES